MKKQLLLISSVLLSSTVFAGGYQLNLQGMRQLAMGGTGAAVPWDVSTIFYNPGGLTAIRNVQAYASMNLLAPNTRYVSAPTGSTTHDALKKTYTPFNLYVGAPIAYKSRVSIGLGVYTPFGTGINWGDNWEGRYAIQSVQLQTIFFQPTVAYEVSDEISVGAGFIYATGNVELRKAIPLLNSQGEDGSAELTGRGNGVGYNLGLHIKASEHVKFGFTYRSKINMKVRNGYARFSVPSSVSSSFINTSFESSLPMPQVVTAGIAINVNKKLTLTADANFTGWAAYDSLIFDYKDNTPALQDSRSPRRYSNTLALRAGLHYKFGDRVAGMLGAAYDPSPIRDGFLNPDLPDMNRVLATGGLSVKLFKRITAIGVVEYIFSSPRQGYSREAGMAGKYQTKVLNPGLAISYDF